LAWAMLSLDHEWVLSSFISALWEQGGHAAFGWQDQQVQGAV